MTNLEAKRSAPSFKGDHEGLLFVVAAFLVLVVPISINPFAFDGYADAKWDVLLFLGAIALGIVVLSMTCRFKKVSLFIPEVTAVIPIIMGISVFWHFLSHPPVPQLTAWSQRLAAFVFFVILLQMNPSKFYVRLNYLFMLSSMPIVARWLFWDVPNTWRNGEFFFGNINFAAEYLGAVAVIHVFLFLREQVRWRKIALALYGVALWFCIWTLASRSVLVAFFLAATGMALFRYYGARSPRSIGPGRKGAFFGLVAFVAFVAILPLFFQWGPLEKSWRIGPRLEFWLSTLRLIIENPLGVGPGNFSATIWSYRPLASVPIQENLILKSPHNELLRHLAEDGLPLTLCFLVAGFWIVWMLVKRVSVEFSRGESTHLPWELLALGVFAYFIVQSSLQYTGQNPPSVMVFCFGLVIAARSCFASSERSAKWVLAPLALLLGMAGIFQGQKIYMDWHYLQKSEHVVLECRSPLWHFATCVRQVHSHMERGRFRDAQELLNRLEEKRGFHPTILKLQSLAALSRGDLRRGCALVARYSRIFSGQHSLADVRQAYCASYTVSPDVDG